MKYLDLVFIGSDMGRLLNYIAENDFEVRPWDFSSSRSYRGGDCLEVVNILYLILMGEK